MGEMLAAASASGDMNTRTEEIHEATLSTATASEVSGNETSSLGLPSKTLEALRRAREIIRADPRHPENPNYGSGVPLINLPTAERPIYLQPPGFNDNGRPDQGGMFTRWTEAAAQEDWADLLLLTMMYPTPCRARISDIVSVVCKKRPVGVRAIYQQLGQAIKGKDGQLKDIDLIEKLLLQLRAEGMT